MDCQNIAWASDWARALVVDVHPRSYPAVAMAIGALIALALLACHAETGYMITNQPCHAGGGCQLLQTCIDGYCAVSETYPFGRDSKRTPGYAATVSDAGDD